MSLPQGMQRSMAAEAEATREARAKVNGCGALWSLTYIKVTCPHTCSYAVGLTKVKIPSHLLRCFTTLIDCYQESISRLLLSRMDPAISHLILCLPPHTGDCC